MKNLIQITLLSLMLVGAMYQLQAQTPVKLKQVWTKQLSSSSGDEVVNGMAVHPDGTVLLSGRFNSAGMDVDAPNNLTISTASAFDGFMVQYNAAGTVQFRNAYNYNQNDAFNTTVFGLNKKRYALGAFNSGIGNFNYACLAIASADSSSTALVANFANNGTLVNTYSGSAADESGFIYGGGHFGGTTNVNNGRSGTSNTATVNITSAGAQDAMLIKHYPDRSVRWAYRFGSTGNDYIHSVYVKGSEVYAVGRFEGTVDFDPSVNTFNLTATTGISNGFILKMDTAGNFLNAWAMLSTGASICQDIKVDVDGNMYLAAYFSGTADVDFGTGVSNVASAGGIDAAFIKLTSSGNLVWARNFGGALDDYATRLAIDGSDAVYMVGYFNSASINVGYPNTTTLTNAGTATSDGYIIGYDTAGQTLCGERIGGLSNEIISQAGFDSNHNLYIAGYFSSTSIQTELVSGYSKTLTLTLGYDGFLVKYNTICPYLGKRIPYDQVGCAGKNIQLNTDVFGSSLSYQWKFNGGNISNGAKYAGVDSSGLSITSLQAADTGSYHIEVSRNGCASFNSDSVKVKLNTGVLSVTPTLFYRMEGNLNEENGGTAITYSGSPFSSDRFNNGARAYGQGSASGFLNIPDVNSAQYTVSLWVNISSPITQTIIWGGTSLKELQYNGGKLGMYNGQFIDFGYSLSQNTWYHIGYVKDGTRCRVYVDGVKVYENATLLTASATNVSVIMGTNGTEGLIGSGDELRVYNSALSDEQVQTLFMLPQQYSAAKLVAKCEGSTVVLYTKLNGGQNLQWYKDGVALTNGTLYAGVTSDSLIITNAQASETGKYVLQAINDCVLFSSDTTNLYVGNAQLGQSQFARFPFNNSIVDAVGSLTATGTIVYSSTTHYSDGTQSASFNAGAGRTSVSFASIPNDTLSVSMWFMPSNITGVARTLLGSNTSNARHLSISTTNKLGYVNAAGTFVSSSITSLTHSVWYHLVVTKMGNNQKIYVNGQLVMNDNNSFLNSLTANALTRIGGGSGSVEQAYGLIDDVRIYTRELNPLEVNGLYKLVDVRTNPVSVSSCNAIDNVFMTAAFDNSDTTLYSLQWKKDGVAISNGTKYNGANARTLWVYAAEHADTGMYTLTATPNGLACLAMTTSAARLSITPINSLTDSLSLFVRFTNATTDVSAYNRTINSATAVSFTTDRNGATNAAGVFNGSTSMLSASGVLATNLTSYTVMAWFKANQSTGGIVSTANSNQTTVVPTLYHSWLYIGTDNKLRGKAYNGNVTSMASAVDVNDNQWHHAALVVTPTTQYLYLDGMEVANQASNANVVPTTYVIAGNMYGGWSNTLAGWNNFLQGNIDEIKVYNRSLTANEINRSAIPMGFAFAGNQTKDVCVGSPLSLFSQGVGSGVVYQWYKNGLPLSGADTSVFNLTSASLADSGFYQCAVTKNCFSIWSDTIQVGVHSAINITRQPLSGSACLGGTLVVSTRAKGVALQYQWKKNGVALINGGAVSGATSDTLRISGVSSLDAGMYSVTINDSCSNTMGSDTAVITVNSSAYAGVNSVRAIYPFDGHALSMPSSSFNGTPYGVSNANNRFGQSSGALSFNRVNSTRVVLPINTFSTNSGYAVSIWFKTSTANTTMGLVGLTSGAPTANPTSGWSPILFINNTGKLSGKIYDVNGTAPQSTQSVTDGVWHQALITGNGSAQYLYLDGVLVGSSSGSYSTTITPYTTIGGSYSASNGWSGHTNGWQYFTGDLDDVRFYNSYFSASEVLAQYTRPEITSQPVATNLVCPGAASQILSVAANGSNVQYAWYKNGNQIFNSANISGASTNTITVSNIQPNDSGYYYARVINGCNYVATDSSELIVNSVPEVTLSPANQASCTGGSVALTLQVSGKALSYQWQKDGVNLSNGGNISGATSSVLTVSALSETDTANYRCIVSNACGSDTSSEAKISLGATLQILQQPLTQNICTGNNVVVFVRTNDPSATFTWQRDGVNIGSLSNDSLTLGSFSAGLSGNYRVIVNSVCGIDTSDVAVLSALTLPTITTQPRGIVGLCGSASLNLSVAATGSGLSYQWQFNGVDIPNATASTYSNTSPTAADTGTYRVIVTGVCGVPLTSTVSNVSISQPITVTTQPIGSLTICSGNSSYVNLNIAATGTILGYQWLRNGVPITNSNGAVSGATGTNLQFLNTWLGAGNYSCRIFGACDTVTTSATVFSYIPFPTIVSSLESKSICSGSDVSFKIQANGAVEYRWFINGSMVSDITGRIEGSTTDSIRAYAVTAADIGGTSASVYVVAFNGCPNQSQASNVVNLNLTNGIFIAKQSNTQFETCEGNEVLLYVNASSEATYVWKRNGVTIPNETNDTLLISGVALADSGSYTCEASSLCGNAVSMPIDLVVYAGTVPVISRNGNELSTGEFNSYQWYKDGTLIANATDRTFTPTENGIYSVIVQNLRGCFGESAQFNFNFTSMNDVFGNGSSVRLYPNPTQHELYLETIDVDLNTTIEVLDISGKRVVVQEMANGKIDVSTLSSGMYILKLTTKDNQIGMIRFVKR